MIKQLSSISSKDKNYLELLFIASVVISPLFLLTVSGWMTRIVVLCALLAFFVQYKTKKSSNPLHIKNQSNIYTKLLCISLSLPTIAVFLGQVFNGNLIASYYDSPIHILICVLVLLAVKNINCDTVKWMSYIFPVALIIALANIIVAPNLFWGTGRLTTNALDPLMFGSLSLTLGLLSLVSIKLDAIKSRWIMFYKLVGFAAGVYLSIASGSRTGWMALPLVGLLWLYVENHKYSIVTKAITMVTASILLFATYSASTVVHHRVNVAFQELSTYQWNPISPNADTSVGARISFVRIALFLFEKKPLSGWGDGNFENVINDPALNFASAGTKRVALEAGFHNDITANMVRSGVWGLTATILLFLVPAILFLRCLKSSKKNQRDVAFLAATFLICQFVSSMTMEIFTLKYSSSFYGLMIAILSGTIMSYNTVNYAGNTSKSS
ncbi:O-antigen ligase family protein [Rhodoferax antarcticus]|uniref:O-antigen ligase family protein n=1 Tax=Rhodoferax antarcticus TaxID=81479 RepID=UPI0022258F4E|nr:O-antigen ligase family protein [Rhodoferax antarcticus]MCW2314236.1 O-antigen ligase [Rhodoferax antarcticus]